MCMFCAAIPAVAAVTAAVAQHEQRLKMSQGIESTKVSSAQRRPAFVVVHARPIGAFAVAGLLTASVLYHTHLPG